MADNDHPNVASGLFAREPRESDWARYLGIKCAYPDGADRCAGCMHYLDPVKYPECSYSTPEGTVMPKHRGARR